MWEKLLCVRRRVWEIRAIRKNGALTEAIKNVMFYLYLLLLVERAVVVGGGFKRNTFEQDNNVMNICVAIVITCPGA